MTIELEIQAGIASLRISQPSKKNALNVAMRDALTDHCRSIARNAEVRAVLLTGAASDFCSGMDVGGMEPRGPVEARERLRGLQSTVLALQAIEKPVVAAVRGAAAGYGWSLALACDMVLASSTARFGQVFRRVGLAPDGGSAFFLARNVGHMRASELIYSGRLIGAEEALAMGLANKVIPDEHFDAVVATTMRDLAQGPTFALGMSKRMLQATGPSLEAFFETELLIQSQLKQSFDHEEGVAAFREKRAAEFQGR